MAEPQFLIGTVHLFEILRKIMNISFMAASSPWKDSRVFRFRRSVEFSDSTAFVVYIAQRISGGNFMYGATPFRRPPTISRSRGISRPISRRTDRGRPGPRPPTGPGRFP